MKPKSDAFTLVEVLLVSSLVALVSLAIFRCFGNGLKLWGKAQHLNREAEVVIFLDKMAEDLRSTVVMSGFNFKGTAQQLSFPATVNTRADQRSARKKEEMVWQIGAVKYRYDVEGRAIYRQQANYAQASKKRWSQEEVPVVKGIEGLEFHYDIASDKGFLLKSEISEGVPLGVMVEVRFNDEGGPHQFKRFLSIPVGG